MDNSKKIIVAEEITTKGFLEKVLFFLFRKKFSTHKIFKEIPEQLHNLPISNAFEKGLLLAETLKKIGWLTKIQKIPQLPDEPQLHLYSAEWSHNKPGGRNGDFFEDGPALLKCLSELVERKAWYDLPLTAKSLRSASMKEVGNKSAFNLFTLAGFTYQQKTQFPFLRFSEDTPFTWTRVNSITGYSKKWCPAQLVSDQFVLGDQKNKRTEPILRFATTNGLATSPNSTEEAVLHGLLELIEREAFMVTYTNSHSPKKISIKSLRRQSDKIDEIIDRISQSFITPILLLLPTDFPVYVVYAVFLDDTGKGPSFTSGAKASFSLEEAVIGALREATTAHTSMCLSESWKEPASLIGSQGIHERAVFWAKPENRDKINFLLDGEEITIPLTEDTLTPKKRMGVLKKFMKSKKLEAYYYVFPLPKEIRLKTVMVVAPQLIPISLTTNIPYLGGSRFETIPKECGFTIAKTKNLFPHPFL